MLRTVLPIWSKIWLSFPKDVKLWEKHSALPKALIPSWFAEAPIEECVKKDAFIQTCFFFTPLHFWSYFRAYFEQKANPKAVQ